MELQKTTMLKFISIMASPLLESSLLTIIRQSSSHLLNMATKLASSKIINQHTTHVQDELTFIRFY